MAHGKGSHYCKTRYGMIGFSKILELNPRFKGMTVRNICLSYLRQYPSTEGGDYCTHCTTMDLREALEEIRNEDDLVRYLLKESQALFEKK